MAKYNITTKSARRALDRRRQPYFVRMGKAQAIGYRRSTVSGDAGTWTARITDYEGKKRWQPLGIADDIEDAGGMQGDTPVLDFDGAQDAARKWFGCVLSGDMGVESTLETGDDVLDRYLAWFKDNRKSYDATRLMIERHIRPVFGHLPIHKISKIRIVSWHAAMGTELEITRVINGKTTVVGRATTPRQRKSTANRILTTFKAAFNHCFKGMASPSDTWYHAQRQWAAVEPFKGVESKRVHFMSSEESARFIGAIDYSPFRDLAGAALLTGARYSELGRLKNYDFNGASIYIGESKGGHARHVFLNDEGKAFFAALTAGRPENDRMLYRDGMAKTWNQSNQSERMKVACKAAGVKVMGFHALRHTYATQMLMAGMADVTLAKLLGHSSTTEIHKHYSHITDVHIAEKVEQHMPNVGAVIPDNVLPFKQVA